MSNYTYQVLTAQQVKLLDEYSPWSYKVHLSQLIDEALAGERLGIFDHLTTVYDAIIGRDLYVAGDGYITGGLNVGGGYGSTGWSCTDAGETTQDGLADLSVGGCKIKEDAIANSGSAGLKGEITYGTDGGTDYLYVCIADNTWRRCTLVAF